jgi:type VI secretion system protein ImpG
MDDGLADVLSYYQRELLYLRNQGNAFAQLYPKIAARLELDGEGSADPHVQRLIESFAFLTARLQRSLDNEFPELPAAMLDVLYPQLVNPVPSMAIARFDVDAAQARAVAGFTLPAHTQVFGSAIEARGERLTCRFRTAYPVDLWPIRVARAAFLSPAEFRFLDDLPGVASVLCLRLECLGRQGFADVTPQRLRFHIAGGPTVSGRLYELVFNNTVRVATLPEGADAPNAMLPADAVRPVGFGKDEGVLPYPPSAHLGYRLIQEYFSFPEKFLFFDLEPLPSLGSGRAADLLFLLNAVPARHLDIGAESFALGCTPIVNLFTKTAEPITLDQTRVEYPLVPDNRFERSTEIHSILRVAATSPYVDDSSDFQPYYSYNHHSIRTSQRAFWITRRQPAMRADLPGSEILISFVDLNLQPARPPAQTIFVQTLATNRGLAEQMPARTPLEIEVDAPVSRILCLAQPTRQLSPPMRGQTLWRLVSHLSLNHLSLGGGEESLAALREILRLYSQAGDDSIEKQIVGIHALSSRPVVRRIGSEAWRGFCRGVEVTLEFDETLYAGANAFLLSAVLSRFLALHAATDSFTELVARSRQREEIWRRWPAQAGEKIVL